MIDPSGRRAAGALAVALTLLVVMTALLSSRSSHRQVRIVGLSVGEELALDPAGRNRLRLVALTADPDGRHSLFLETLPLSSSARPTRLIEREPLQAFDCTLRLVDVRPDTTQGASVQLQWVPRDSGGSRPIFSVSDEPVPFPIDDRSLELRILGGIPPPGRGVLDFEVIGLPRGAGVGRLVWGRTASIGDMGELRWIGTRERFVARIEIR